jgi:hypothetical protein
MLPATPTVSTTSTHDERDYSHPMSPHVGEIDGDQMAQTQVHALGSILNQHEVFGHTSHSLSLAE